MADQLPGWAALASGQYWLYSWNKNPKTSKPRHVGNPEIQAAEKRERVGRPQGGFHVPRVSACFSILVGAFALPLVAQAPAIVVHRSNSELRMPSAMAVALAAVDSTFQPYREVDYLPPIREGYRPKRDETLYAVIGDFNGDGVPDLVVDGQGRDSSYLVALVSRRGGYQAHVLRRAERQDPQAIRYDGEHGLWVYLSRQAPRRIESPFEARPLDLRTDAFQVNYFEKSAVVYYWHDGDFKEYWTGD